MPVTLVVTVGLAEPLAGELLVGPYLGYRLGYVGPGSVLEGRQLNKRPSLSLSRGSRGPARARVQLDSRTRFL